MSTAGTRESSRIDGQSQLGVGATLRRGLQLSPELKVGLWLTVALALVATVGRVVIPFVVQQATDNGIQAEGGPDVGFVLGAIGIAAVVDQGSHEELLGRCRGYVDLVQAYSREAAERAAVTRQEEGA